MSGVGPTLGYTLCRNSYSPACLNCYDTTGRSECADVCRIADSLRGALGLLKGEDGII